VQIGFFVAACFVSLTGRPRFHINESPGQSTYADWNSKLQARVALTNKRAVTKHFLVPPGQEECPTYQDDIGWNAESGCFVEPGWQD